MTQAPFPSYFLTSLGPKKPGQVSAEQPMRPAAQIALAGFEAATGIEACRHGDERRRLVGAAAVLL